MDKRCVSYDKTGKLQNYDERCILGYLVAAHKNDIQKIDILTSEVTQMGGKPYRDNGSWKHKFLIWLEN